MGTPLPTIPPYLLEPPPELVKILEPAYRPCAGFAGNCQGCVIWNPDPGEHVPRCYRGATDLRAPSATAEEVRLVLRGRVHYLKVVPVGRLADVKLVLVSAEPGDPYHGTEPYPPSGRPLDYLRLAYTRSCGHLNPPSDQFAQNIRAIMDMAWPGLPFDQQMRRTWLTPSVLCSARRQGAPHAIRVERECAERYLCPQMELFQHLAPNVRIVALGGKAQNRLRLCKPAVPFVPARAASPPGCNRRDARDSWRRAVAGLDPGP
jgi:hypothetical protein